MFLRGVKDVVSSPNDGGRRTALGQDLLQKLGGCDFKVASWGPLRGSFFFGCLGMDRVGAFFFSFLWHQVAFCLKACLLFGVSGYIWHPKDRKQRRAEVLRCSGWLFQASTEGLEVSKAKNCRSGVELSELKLATYLSRNQQTSTFWFLHVSSTFWPGLDLKASQTCGVLVIFLRRRMAKWVSGSRCFPKRSFVFHWATAPQPLWGGLEVLGMNSTTRWALVRLVFSTTHLYQDPQRNAFWLVLCNRKPPKSIPLGV